MRTAVNKRRRELRAAKKQRGTSDDSDTVKTRYKAHKFNDSVDIAFNVGSMNQICRGCRALHFETEKPIGRKTDTFLECCNHGKIHLPELRAYPPLLRSLLEPLALVDQETSSPSLSSLERDPQPQLAATRKKSNDFKLNIRSYNSALATAGLHAELDSVITRSGGGPYCYRIHGQVGLLFNSLQHTYDGYSTIEVDNYTKMTK